MRVTHAETQPVIGLDDWTADHELEGVVADDDPRLSDPRQPTAHAHPENAPTVHTHAYADPAHNHDGTYALTHSHPYAATGHSHVLVDGDIPASIARDTEVSAAVTAHEAAGNPHATYATDADLTAHAGAVDPHPVYLTSAEGNAAYAPTHSHPYEASGAVATHAAAGDPHPTYLTAAEGNAAYLPLAAHPHANDHVRQHSITAAADHTFPGGTTTFLRADGTFQAPPAGGAPVYADLGTGTALALATNSVVKISPSATGTLTTTVPAAGNYRQVILLQTNTSAKTMTFGSGFKPTGTLALGTTASRVFVTNWVSDGTNLYEAGRTAAMVA